MKNLKILFFLIISIIVSVSCEEVLNDGKAIILDNGKSEYNVSADEQTLTISFNTTGEWEARLEDITENTEIITPDWISISAENGAEAGKYDIETNIKENTDNKSRKAALYIICKETVLKIYITQKGKEDAQPQGQPKQIKELRLYESVSSKAIKFRNGMKTFSAMTAKTKNGGYVSVFLKTDDRDRVTKVLDNSGNVSNEFIYGDNMLTLNSFDDGTMETYYYNYENGRITKGISSTLGENNDRFTYTSDGYLSEYRTQASHITSEANPDGQAGEDIVEIFDIVFKYTWSDGCFTTLHNYWDLANSTSSYKYSFEYYPGVSGISNVCLANIIIDNDMWSIYRLAGKSCDRLIRKMVENGKTTNFRYEFDSDGAVSKVHIENEDGEKEMIEIIY